MKKLILPLFFFAASAAIAQSVASSYKGLPARYTVSHLSTWFFEEDSIYKPRPGDAYNDSLFNAQADSAFYAIWDSAGQWQNKAKASLVTDDSEYCSRWVISVSCDWIIEERTENIESYLSHFFGNRAGMESATRIDSINAAIYSEIPQFKRNLLDSLYPERVVWDRPKGKNYRGSSQWLLKKIEVRGINAAIIFWRFGIGNS